MKSGKLVRLCLFVVAASVFLLAGVLVYVRTSLPGDRVAHIAIRHLEASLGQRIVFSAAHFSWLSATRARLVIADLALAQRDQDTAYLTIAECIVELDVVPLFTGALVMDRVSLTRPTVFLSSGNEGSPKGNREAASSPITRFSRFAYPRVKHLDVAGGRLVLRNQWKNQQSEASLLEGIDLSASDLSPSGFTAFALRGRTAQDFSPGAFEINGRIDSRPLGRGHWDGNLTARARRCPILPFVTLASHFGFHVPLVQGECDLDIKAALNRGSWEFTGGLAVNQAIFPSGRFFLRPTTVENARLEFRGVFREDALQLDVTRLVLPGMRVAADLAADRILSTDPVIALTVTNAELNLEKLFPIIPLNLIGPEDRRHLARAGLKGRIELTDAKWSGRASHLTEGEFPLEKLVLSAHLKDVSGFVPKAGLQISEASGAVRISENLLSFKDFSLVLGGSPIELRGSVSALQSGMPQIDLFVSLTAEAEDLIPILTNRFVSRQLPPWFKQVHEPSGSISVSLDLKGDLGRPSLRGRIDLDGFGCTLGEFPLPLAGVNGSVMFRGSAVRLANLRGRIGSTETEATGDLSHKNISFAAAARVAPADMKKLKWWPSGWKLSGTVPMNVSLSGNPADWQFTARADLKANQLSIGSVIRKKPGKPLTVEAGGHRGPKGVAIEEAYLVIGSSRIALKGAFNEDGTIALLVNLPPRGIQTDELVSVIHPKVALQPGGRIEGDVSITLGPDIGRDLSLDAKLVINHVSFHPWGFFKPWRGLTGTIKWHGQSIDAVMERVKIGNSMATGTLSIRGFVNPRVDVTLQFPFLDTTDFTAPPGHVDDTTWSEWIRENYAIRFLARSQGKGLLRVQKGKTWTRSFSDFEAKFVGARGIVKATDWKMAFAGGILRGSAEFDIRRNTKVPFAVDFQADNLRMARLLLANPDRVSIRGNLLGEGRMEWKTTPRRENAGIYKTGRMELRVSEGVIRRFEILSKIFSLINFGSILRGRLPDIATHGLPFHRLTWQMDVFDTKWKVEDLKLLSDATRIDAAGMYFSDQDRIDFVVDVSPLVGLDALVTGLFGNLITRDAKILTTRFKVRGLSQTPDVRLEPLASFNGK